MAVPFSQLGIIAPLGASYGQCSGFGIAEHDFAGTPQIAILGWGTYVGFWVAV